MRREALWAWQPAWIWRFAMTVLSITPCQPQNAGTPSRSDGLLATFERWWVAYLTWQLERATIAHLSKLSDRELRDVGLNRSEIPAAVRGAATSPLMTSCN
jgi:uncharacterized protein YjiS (DUF1127 family)